MERVGARWTQAQLGMAAASGLRAKLWPQDKKLTWRLEAQGAAAQPPRGKTGGPLLRHPSQLYPQPEHCVGCWPLIPTVPHVSTWPGQLAAECSSQQGRKALLWSPWSTPGCTGWGCPFP